MNKIEELEAQLMAERIKVQIDLKEKYKWVIGKYVKHDDSFMIRIDDICHVYTSCMNGYAELVELDIKTIERIKANDEQSETRTS